MNEQERDQLINMLLCEVVGKEMPPDVLERVLQEVGEPVAGDVPVSRPPVAPFRPRAAAVRRSSGVRQVFAIAALIALLAVPVVLLKHRRDMMHGQSARVVAATGECHHPAGRIGPGASLSTGDDGNMTVEWADGTRVELAPFSKLRVVAHSKWKPDKVMRLETGRLTAAVVPQPDGHPLRISTANAETVVLGTRFRLVAVGGRTRLEVEQGRVRYEADGGGEVEVDAGSYAESGADLDLQSGSIERSRMDGSADSTPPAVVGFTLMNADTDQPIEGFDPIKDDAEIRLSALPTRKINFRANTVGKVSEVEFKVTRRDGGRVRLPSGTSKVQHFEPFFLAGDHSKEGRPEDGRPWRPDKGLYRLTGVPGQRSLKRAGAEASPFAVHFSIIP